MTQDELEITVVTLIHEMNRLNAQVQNIKVAVAALLDQKPSELSPAELKDLISAHLPDAQLDSLSATARILREKIENVRKNSGSEK